jgi:hypothetical protein
MSRLHAPRLRHPPRRHLLAAWQPHGELGECARFALHGDRAAMLLGDDVVADRAEPGAFAGRLGGEERLEQFFPCSGGQAASEAAAYSMATANGFTNGVGGVHVTAHSPPQTGPNTDNSSAVEVIITQTETPVFAGWFIPSLTIGNRAVAAWGAASPRVCWPWGIMAQGGTSPKG